MSDKLKPHHQNELLNTQNLGENVHTDKDKSSNEELVKQHEVPGSPFKHIETPSGHFLTIGGYRVSEPFNTADQLDTWMNTCQWMLIFNMIVTMTEILKKQNLEQIEKT